LAKGFLIVAKLAKNVKIGKKAIFRFYSHGGVTYIYTWRRRASKKEKNSVTSDSAVH